VVEHWFDCAAKLRETCSGIDRGHRMSDDRGRVSMRAQMEIRKHTKATDIRDTPIDCAASIIEVVDVVVGAGRNLPRVSADANVDVLLI
jgi:hypothetical protein